MGERLHAYGVSALVLGLALCPALRDLSDDDFPLSTYPMFARERARVGDVISALAVGRDQRSVPVPPSYIANSEAMQAVSTLRRTVHAGPKAARALCKAIAARVSHADAAELSQAREIRLVTHTVDAIDYLAGRAQPTAERVHARCRVPKAGAP